MAKQARSEIVVHPDEAMMAVLKELLETTKENNDILKENQQILLEGLRLMKDIDERMRKLVLNTSGLH